MFSKKYCHEVQWWLYDVGLDSYSILSAVKTYNKKLTFKFYHGQVIRVNMTTNIYLNS